MNHKPLTGVYALTLRAPDGQERRTLAWFPNGQVRQEFYEKARRNGLEILNNELNALGSKRRLTLQELNK